MIDRVTYFFVELLTPRRVLYAIIGLLFVLVCWKFSAYQRGMVAARFDVACGHYEVERYGELPPLYISESYRLVQERYGVRIQSVGSCTVSPMTRAYADGYNAISEPEIVAHFGKNIFAECASEAKAQWAREENSMKDE